MEFFIRNSRSALYIWCCGNEAKNIGSSISVGTSFFLCQLNIVNHFRLSCLLILVVVRFLLSLLKALFNVYNGAGNFLLDFFLLFAL